MEEYSLEDLFDLQMGKTPARDNIEYWNGGNNDWISIGDLSRFNKYVGQTKEQITDLAITESGIKEIPPNTVIMSFKLSIGKVVITTEKTYSNEAIMAFIDKKVKCISSDYLYYLLLSREWNEGANKAVMGMTLNKATLSKIKVKLHDIKEQEQIASILDKSSKLILFKKQQLVELDTLIISRFVEMFGDPIDIINNKETILIENITNAVNVGFVGESAKEYVERGIPYLRMQNIREVRLDTSNLIYINENFHNRIENAHVYTEDIVISRVGVNRGQTAVIPQEFNNSSIGNAVIIRKSNTFNSIFVASYINMVFGKHTEIGYSKGSAQGAISVSLVKKWPVPNVSHDLQNQFAAFVQQVDKLKFEVQKSLNETQLLFDSLMQEYFG